MLHRRATFFVVVQIVVVFPSGQSTSKSSTDGRITSSGMTPTPRDIIEGPIKLLDRVNRMANIDIPSGEYRVDNY
jgi:hypothetical protein